ncbi:hypothetical protein IF2G_01649 [Cordyceps javanica]|nr:hypothetical protein IF2G_01649 [Cordyceps javanica]
MWALSAKKSQNWPAVRSPRRKALYRAGLALARRSARDWDVVLKSVVTIPATDQRLQQLINVIEALQKKNTAEVEIWDAKTWVSNLQLQVSLPD